MTNSSLAVREICFIPVVNFYTSLKTFPRSSDGEADRWSLRKGLGLLSNMSICEKFTTSIFNDLKAPENLRGKSVKILEENLNLYKYTHNIQLQTHMLVTSQSLQSLFLSLSTMEHAILKQSLCDSPCNPSVLNSAVFFWCSPL